MFLSSRIATQLAPLLAVINSLISSLAKIFVWMTEYCGYVSGNVKTFEGNAEDRLVGSKVASACRAHLKILAVNYSYTWCNLKILKKFNHISLVSFIFWNFVLRTAHVANAKHLSLNKITIRSSSGVRLRTNRR